MMNEGLEYELLDTQILPGTETEEDATGFSVEGATVIPLYLYKLEAGATRQVRIRVRPSGPIGIGDGIVIGFRLFPPNPEALFTYSGNLVRPSIWTSEAGRPTNWTTVWLVSATLRGRREAPPKATGSAASPAAAASQGGGDPPPTWSTTRTRHQMRSSTRWRNRRDRARSCWASVIRAVGVAVGLSNRRRVGDPHRRAPLSQLADPAGANPSSGESCGIVGGSFDPNDKLGPGGVLAERYYRPERGAPYTIRFENLDTATFPAQEVVIVDTLDTSVFDLSTFQFGPIRWGASGELVPPPGAQRFEAEVSLAPDFDATLLVTAGLDRESGQATWSFVTIDNQTGDLPEDGTVGFLPPNQTQPEGEGSVGFVVDARAGLPTGTAVSNQAEIVFDVNAPIVTPLWTNTVDVTPPASSVQPLAPQSQAPFEIEVSGADVGAGVDLYKLYAQRRRGRLRTRGREPRVVVHVLARGARHVRVLQPHAWTPSATRRGRRRRQRR